jgi:predicted PhzF superfamily epimerase YddE/YHI9
MEFQVFIVDAFADRPLAGNPAAVCPLGSWLPESVMQAVAEEMNLSETVFFVPQDDGFAIRWFAPAREVDLVGHATLAAGHIVLERQRPGTSAALTPREVVPPEQLVSALGAPIRSVWAAKHYLAVFDRVEEVMDLAPDMAALAALDLPAVAATAPGGAGSDFVSRFFAPAHGVPEDPVSGVAHCCLTPYWSQRLGKRKLVGRQLSRRGGVVHCEDRGERVVLGGDAVTVLEGRFRI